MNKLFYLLCPILTYCAFPRLRPSQTNGTPAKDVPNSPVLPEEPDFGGKDGGDLNLDADISADGAPPHSDPSVLGVDNTGDGGAPTTPEPRRTRVSVLETLGQDEAGLSHKEVAALVTPPRRRRRTTGPTRLRKRRRVVVDNDRTELSNDHIRAMLRDTSDIVWWGEHPAAWPRNKGGNEEEQAHSSLSTALQWLPATRLLARPCLGDDTGLAPELLAMWGRNARRVTGEASAMLPFRMRGIKGEEQRHTAAARIRGEEAAKVGKEKGKKAAVEDAKKTRSQGTSMQKCDVIMSDVELDGGDQDPNAEKAEEEQDEDMEIPFEINEDSAVAENIDDDCAEEEKDESSVCSDRSGFSLGAVNDLEKDLYGDEDDADEGDDPRQTVGDELVSHTSKWHKHTIRVLSTLKRNIRSGNTDELDKEEMAKPAQLGYHRLSAGCSRRTASGVFFEMLQLKTWDFVELNQVTSYGDINIIPGPRFDEPPPSDSS